MEPFAGSLAVLLGRPDWTPGMMETANDKDGYIVNTWRSIQSAPEETAKWASGPVHENTLHAVHAWLLAHKADLVARLEGDPDYFDAKIAGRWLWGISAWIGSGWCSGEGPWHVVDGRLVKTGEPGGIKRQRPHYSDGGQGVHRKRPHYSDGGMGVHRRGADLYAWFDALSRRLEKVTICCGDWLRVLGPSVTTQVGRRNCAVFLDPPYSLEAERDRALYTCDDLTVAAKVRTWCLENGDDPLLRIAYCSYGEADPLPGWERFYWRAHGGYANQGSATGQRNKHRETIEFSPHCLRPGLDLFGADESEDRR